MDIWLFWGLLQGMVNIIRSGVVDLVTGLRRWEFFVSSAWFDIRLNYRRSFLGPIWITIVSGIHILVLGFIFGHLFDIRSSVFFPWVAVGIIMWHFAAQYLQESTHCLARHRGYLLEGRIPFSAFVLRDLVKSIILLAHTMINYVILALVFQIMPNEKTLLVLVTLPAVVLALFPIGLLVAMLTARFKDFRDMVQSVLTVLFFLTPIMWHPSQIRLPHLELVLLNPASAYLNMVRMPLLGQWPSVSDVVVFISTATIFWMLALYMVGRYRHRIAFWV